MPRQNPCAGETPALPLRVVGLFEPRSRIVKADSCPVSLGCRYLRRMTIRFLMVAALLVASCTAETNIPPSTTTTTGRVVENLIDSDERVIPPAPGVPTGPLPDGAVELIESVWQTIDTVTDPADVTALGAVGDPRVAWLLSDLLRFVQGGPVGDAAAEAFTELTGAEIRNGSPGSQWRGVTDLLIAWDMPAPPGYAAYKERLFTLVEPGWQPFFDDAAGDVDWRWISWGGVLIDARPLGDLDPCLRGCIPALDDPPVTDAAGGSWYPDEAIVFGVTINGESRAYPKNIMEVHEMVNDTLGERRIAMPYCTLCGSAQAFFTDEPPSGINTLVLRTSGLLSRSNKVMYELQTQSMFDTFLGVALTGPLREAGYTLEPVTVVTSTWGEWKQAHPETTIVVRDGGRGITYPADPLRGRDDNGPIFPVGDVDPRLPVQTSVVGVVTPDGAVIAFPAEAARAALDAGAEVSSSGVSLSTDGGGFRAYDAQGNELSTHQSFWFAWSQFQPDTTVWAP